MPDMFENRHLGVNNDEVDQMLHVIGVSTVDELIDQTIPNNIRLIEELNLPDALTEYEYLNHIREIGKKNKVFRSYIGRGYYGTITPAVIRRNIFENPGWYTQYTPYQSEISQGRLEALLNFQTMVCELTGMPVANASLLDESTAALEAMMLFYHLKSKKRKNVEWVFYVDKGVFNHTVDVLATRGRLLNIRIERFEDNQIEFYENSLGILLQYPNSIGTIKDYSEFVSKIHENEGFVAVIADILSLTVITPPGEWGADVVVGNTQRLGVPLGYGGPHAAYFATKEEFKRNIPGRIIGVSKDVRGNHAYRMALQTREQHIKRERATSNICTAQALLAIMASMYAVYHGPIGLKNIAISISRKSNRLAKSLLSKYHVLDGSFFDTIQINLDKEALEKIRIRAVAQEINLYFSGDCVRISIDETISEADLIKLCDVFGVNLHAEVEHDIPSSLVRKSTFLSHSTFNSYQTETKLMRYIKSLENKDLSLVHSMIPLGSCTMKLNAAAQLEPLSWPEFANIHPFAPLDQVSGYSQVIRSLEKYLCEITGLDSCSLMPNSGAQGEYAGLLAIRNYHIENGEVDRIVVLIPSSAHGTNPASAIVSGMRVVVVQCDDKGNILLSDLLAKAKDNASVLAGIMITYPSTHGVFESAIVEICDMVHNYGGKVYMDGANMNAQVGLTSPAMIHADICHLNLHKTFSIPHGGGGPGMGPICATKELAPFLPGHIFLGSEGAVASAPYSSASILLISYAYIRLLGQNGVKRASEIAIVNANYLKFRLEKHFSILYTGENGYVAHEMIVDLRPYKEIGISAEDVSKRLMDYSFHSPTLSFPVPGTLMIEPTESEDKDEMDRFVAAMVGIKEEIDEVARAKYTPEKNVLVNAPHTLDMVVSDHWPYPYGREKAAYPLDFVRRRSKFWPGSARIDNAYGDRNLMCTCPPMDVYEDVEIQKVQTT